MAVPEPTEVAPWYLRNITQALELNSATGQVFVRTNADLLYKFGWEELTN